MSDNDTWGNFSTKFMNTLSSDWKFGYATNNLWTLEIQIHDDGTKYTPTNKGIQYLYRNINSVNYSHSSLVGTKWDVRVKSNSLASLENNQNKTFSEWMSKFTSESGLFLCKSIELPNNFSVSCNDDDFTNGGFLRSGQYVKNMNWSNSSVLKATFLETNISLSDLFFEKWIAAISQQGLIDDSELPRLTADVYVYMYSSNSPDISGPKWSCRKISKMIKAFPTNLSLSSTSSLGYSENDSGYKEYEVTFKFDSFVNDYKIL